ncbi:MAG: hypothetical protein R2991_13870 [Thermoanaerobaculia bacterium]
MVETAGADDGSSSSCPLTLSAEELNRGLELLGEAVRGVAREIEREDVRGAA